MAGTVITIAQQKGGAGKTSLTVHLAVALYQAGHSVSLIDIDPQGSLTEWHSRRPEADDFTLSTVEGWRAPSESNRLKKNSDIVLIDSPPHTETGAKVAIRAADAVILPVQPSPMDVWATAPTIAIAQKENVPALVVFNRMPPRGALPDAMRAELAGQDLSIAETSFGNRQVFAASLLEGRGVTEMGSKGGKAALEAQALAAEVLAFAS